MANSRLIDGSEFLHIPKTGGTWVYRILEENNLVKQKGIGGHVHATYDMVAFARGRRWPLRGLNRRRGKAGQSAYRFCFVRHPLQWYESWWKFMCGIGWDDWGDPDDPNGWHPNIALNGLGSDDFNQFVGNVVQARPGYVSELYFSYAKPGISFVGKTENLAKDFLDVMAIRGLPIDEASVRAKGPVHSSKPPPQPIEWDPKLREVVMRLELPALVHFGYLSGEDADRLGVPAALKRMPAVRE